VSWNLDSRLHGNDGFRKVSGGLAPNLICVRRLNDSNYNASRSSRCQIRIQAQNRSVPKDDLSDLNLLNGLNGFRYDSSFRIAGMRQATKQVKTMTIAPIIATVVGAPRKWAEVPANSAPNGMKPRSSM
jgi:hypothetical protein